MTSDERREVAERLREHDGNAYADVADMCDEDLADLIDPTCEFEPMPAYVPSHRFFRWRCKKCGAVCFAPLNATRPRYCPHCGSRVGMTAGEREVS
jgi:rubrerythrin